MILLANKINRYAVNRFKFITKYIRLIIIKSGNLSH